MIGAKNVHDTSVVGAAFLGSPQHSPIWKAIMLSATSDDVLGYQCMPFLPLRYKGLTDTGIGLCFAAKDQSVDFTLSVSEATEDLFTVNANSESSKVTLMGKVGAGGVMATIDEFWQIYAMLQNQNGIKKEDNQRSSEGMTL